MPRVNRVNEIYAPRIYRGAFLIRIYHEAFLIIRRYRVGVN